MVDVIKNTEQYVELTEEYIANIIDGGEAFWSRPPEEIEAAHPHLMMVQFESVKNWQTQEMHPHCDEIVTVLKGEAEFVFNPGLKEETVRVKAGETVIIPKGVWHTGKVTGKVVSQHILMGRGTEVKRLHE